MSHCFAGTLLELKGPGLTRLLGHEETVFSLGSSSGCFMPKDFSFHCNNLNFTSLAGQTQPSSASCFHPSGLTSRSAALFPAFAASSNPTEVQIGTPAEQRGPLPPHTQTWTEWRIGLLRNGAAGPAGLCHAWGSARHLCGWTRPAAFSERRLEAGLLRSDERTTEEMLKQKVLMRPKTKAFIPGS